MPEVVEPEKSDEFESIEWLRDFADELGVEFDDLMFHAEARIRDSWHYWSEGGKFEGEYIPEEFWVHYELVTGKRGEGSFLTCSC